MERKLLQVAFAVAGLVLVGFGLAGVVFGANFTDLSGNVVMDSYLRFLKGMLLAIGLVYWSSVPDIERHGERISLVMFILMLGAVPRLMAVIAHGVPTIGILIGLAGELIFAPLLWLWQGHVARVARRGAVT
ncbi:MAG: DUF4345 domain-containing protein [Bradyrhizobium sp.]